MGKRGAREVVFVCCGLTDTNELVTDIIPGTDQVEATQMFFDLHCIKAQEVLGPFYRKKTQVLENTRSLKFANVTKKAIYNGWKVDAFLLKEPEEHAYLIFKKRVDGKKMSTPKGTMVVPVSYLRFE